MKLFIAEKPSLARAIAGVLGVVKKEKSSIECRDGIVVTWCFGHLLEQCEPEEYDESWKDWSHLPVLPSVFKLKVRKDVNAQMSAIGGLLKKADSVVNAGDPDREGQLLVDEVLEHFKWKGRTERIWLASLDDKSIAKALSSMKDNSTYAPLRDAARARSQADWLIGMNGTRAMTLKGRKAGMSGVQSLGRVQTPTLALVVRRDREIARFKRRDYFLLKADFASGYTGIFVPDETQPGLDNEGRMVDAAEADKIIALVQGKTGEVIDVKREKKTQAPPLPHCLSSLQKAASAKLSMTAQDVLDAAQELYEAKLTTYPRTDCRYLPEEQFDEAESILKALAGIDGLKEIAENADVSIKGAVWNTKKITAHHAIIPTGVMPSDAISGKSLALYLMICRAYCLGFYKPCEYQAVRIVTRVERLDWETKARIVLQPGWTAAGADEMDEEKDDDLATTLPQKLFKGNPVTCTEATKQAKKTSPPPAFTEGTLIEAMASIHRFIDDPDAKKTLKENEGIGTEATRAGILETLKRRGFLEAKGKKLISTGEGRRLIDATPPLLTDPVTTAHWETKLSAIAEGSETLDAFMRAQREIVPELVAAISGAKLEVAKDVPRCPSCGLPLLLRKSAKGNFWSCSGYPDCTECFPDDQGKPGKRATQETEQKCPDCGGNLRKGGNDNGKKPYFICMNKEAHDGQAKFFDDVDGAPVERKPGEATDTPCPECGEMLQHREGQYGPYFLCANRDAHEGKNKIWKDEDGSPVESKPKTEATKFKCPECKGGLKTGTNQRGKYYACFAKEKHNDGKPNFWNDKDGKPDFDAKKK